MTCVEGCSGAIVLMAVSVVTQLAGQGLLV
jgi:hypothetical protein